MYEPRADEFTVEYVMAQSPAIVEPNASLYAVLDEMPNHKGGYTVVQGKSGKVNGVFTSIEAMLAFHDLSSGTSSAKH